MVDYTKLAATATRLITKNGRLVTFVRPTETPVDTDKPWDGPEAGETLLELPVVAVPPNTVRQFGLTALGEGTEFQDLIAFSEQVLICNPEDNDLRQFTFVREGAVEWGIIGLQVLKPANTRLLAFVGVRR